jgi:hypothetical protein
MPGSRLPPHPMRLADWNTVDLQELAPSDGMWKVIFFVCGFQWGGDKDEVGHTDLLEAGGYYGNAAADALG